MRAACLVLAMMGISSLCSEGSASSYLSFRTYYPEPRLGTQIAGTPEPLCTAVRTVQEWKRLWTKMDFLSARRAEPPRVDFQRNTLLMVSLGRQEGDCPEVCIESVIDNPDSIVVIALRLHAEPAPCPSDPFQPAAIVLIERTDKPVTFRMIRAVRRTFEGCP